MTRIDSKGLSETQDGFLRADLARVGDTLTLPDKPPVRIDRVTEGVSWSHKRIIILDTQHGRITYSPRAYIPVTQAN